MGAIKELDLLEEIAARLNRGQGREEFVERLTAFLKVPQVGGSVSNKPPHVSKPRVVAPVAIPTLDHYISRELAVYARIREQYGVDLAWPRGQFTTTLLKLGPERIALWEQKYGLRIGTIPEYAVKPEAAFPPIKPRAWFYQEVAQAKVGRMILGKFVPDTEAFRLRPAVVLFDPRQKPAYKDGRQMWARDGQFLGAIITRLRQSGTLASSKGCPIGSRFGISPNDWEQVIKPALGNQEDFSGVAWQLEPMMVWNFLCQAHPDLPRARDGETSTGLSFEEYCGPSDYRLCGGRADCGGLSRVGWNDTGYRSGYWSPRPLGVLA